MSSNIARIFINNIEIGTIPVSDYDSLRKSVLRQKRLWLAAAFGYARAPFSFVGDMIRYIITSFTVMAFLFVILMTTTEYGADIFAAIQQSSPSSLVQATRNIFNTTILLAIFAFGLKYFITGQHAVDSSKADVFDAEISFRIRQMLETPTTGPMHVMMYRTSEKDGGEVTLQYRDH